MLDDFQRGLTNRGRRAARSIARWFGDNEIQPDLILCSTAVRARETLDLIQSAFGPGTMVKLEKSLYLASADELLDRLRRIDERTASVLIIGHNPGLQELAMLLVPRRERRPMEEKFPTAAVAWLRLSGTWSALRPAESDLVAYKRPADLDA